MLNINKGVKRKGGNSKKFKKSKMAIRFMIFLTIVLLPGVLSIGACAQSSELPQLSSNANANKHMDAVELGDKKIVTTENTQTVVYENVEMRFPAKGEEGYPYIHDIRVNNTDGTIVEFHHGMLAFDKDGHPLEIIWHSLDSNAELSYDFMCDWDSSKLLAGEIYNNDGGWTLYNVWDDKPGINVDKIVYVLYCDKQITFKDGRVWDNPNYEKWLNTYKGKEVSTKILESYYPYVENIIWNSK